MAVAGGGGGALGPRRAVAEFGRPGAARVISAKSACTARAHHKLGGASLVAMPRRVLLSPGRSANAPAPQSELFSDMTLAQRSAVAIAATLVAIVFNNAVVRSASSDSMPAIILTLLLNMLAYNGIIILYAALHPDASISKWNRAAMAVVMALFCASSVYYGIDEYTQTTVPLVGPYHRAMRVAPHVLGALAMGLRADRRRLQFRRPVACAARCSSSGFLFVEGVPAGRRRRPHGAAARVAAVDDGGGRLAFLLTTFLLTPARRSALSVRLGLGLRHVGLGELNSSAVKDLLRSHDANEDAMVRARLAISLRAALEASIAMRNQVTAEWREESAKMRALRALAKHAGLAGAANVGTGRTHGAARARLLIDVDREEAKARRNLSSLSSTASTKSSRSSRSGASTGLSGAGPESASARRG